MAASGDVLEDPNGFRLEIVSLDEKLLVMEAGYPGTGDLPPKHLHPSQEERFTVLSGTVRAIVDGEETVHAEGSSFAVPPGTPHTMTADEPARTRWEVRPALRTADFFEALYTGTAGPTFLDDFAAEFRLADG